jgi:hypothetical protein
LGFVLIRFKVQGQRLKNKTPSPVGEGERRIKSKGAHCLSPLILTFSLKGKWTK